MYFNPNSDPTPNPTPTPTPTPTPNPNPKPKPNPNPNPYPNPKRITEPGFMHGADFCSVLCVRQRDDFRVQNESTRIIAYEGGWWFEDRVSSLLLVAISILGEFSFEFVHFQYFKL